MGGGCTWRFDCIQVDLEGQVNSGRYSKTRSIKVYNYLVLFTYPEGDSCFSIYQISWKKNEKSNFL